MRPGALRTAWRLGLPAAAFALGALAQGRGWLAALGQQWGDVAYLARGHMLLVLLSGTPAVLLGILLGVVLTRPAMRRFAGPVMQVASIGTTVPTLAILALAMTVLGLGTPPAVFGLAALTLLPVLLNTVAGLRQVPQPLREAARGMGMTGRQILLQVELPNAALVILAGVRTALAINVGTVPLAFLIGGGGLGELIFTGIDLMEPSMLLAGALATAALAIAVDLAAGAAQYWLIPRGVNPFRTSST
jgi:osmoprotectant transport system permease protein